MQYQELVQKAVELGFPTARVLQQVYLMKVSVRCSVRTISALVLSHLIAVMVALVQEYGLAPDMEVFTSLLVEDYEAAGVAPPS